MSGRDDEPPVRRNPFSPMAVAKITGFDETTGTELHIDTDASRRAVSYLTEYLENAPNAAGGDRGEVIAIAGDYGTGKTHLAVRIVLHARAVLTDPVRAMYLDATADSFLELYRDLPFEGTPVLSDDEFDRASEQIRGIVEGGVPALV